jgi:hypothetical protein
LEVAKAWGQTSGHSFGNSLKLTSDNKFTGMDLGDNYPRGINFWAFTKKQKEMNVIYCFKTLHGDKNKSPAGAAYPLYKEISTKDKKFYQFSNDNEVYTELSAPGFDEVDDGYIVFFIGEMPSLDNSKTGESVNTPRNVCFTKISKDQKTKLSKGGKQTGGLYDFGGKW